MISDFLENEQHVSSRADYNVNKLKRQIEIIHMFYIVQNWLMSSWVVLPQCHRHKLKYKVVFVHITM